MKETIYTIPITDAFNQDCECAICVLERDLEEKYLEFILGPSSMEPGTRVITNEKGFCRRHFEMLYRKKTSVLSLALVIDTHINQQIETFNSVFDKNKKSVENETKKNAIANVAGKITKKSTPTTKYIDDLANMFDEQESKCDICDRMTEVMDRYYDVIYWMYFKDDGFKTKYINSKGFCLKHYKTLMQTSKKYLAPKQMAIFALDTSNLMKENMDRILEEVQWFAEKFDYRNEKAPWKNSKDAVPRSIEKIVSYCDFKK